VADVGVDHVVERSDQLRVHTADVEAAARAASTLNAVAPSVTRPRIRSTTTGACTPA
jgi:hypothetical protein